MDRRLALSSVLLALGFGSAAHAADIEAKLVIDQVTVYPETANVVRAGRVTVPAGDHRLIIRGLPDPIDTSNLRISAGSTAVRLGGV